MTTQPPDLKTLEKLRKDAAQAAYAGHKFESRGETILALLDAYEASARDAERYRWLRKPNAIRRAAHIAVLTHNGGFVACEEQADQAIDAARHATQGD